MTFVLLRLKVALLRNYMRGTTGGRVGALVVYLVPALLGLASGALLFGARGAPPDGIRVLALTIPTALFIGWVVGPIVTIGLDATVDPVRLNLFPLSTREMTVGLFATSCLGGGGLYTALTFLGLAAGTAPTGPGAVISVVAALLAIGICVAAARAAAAGISTASRRVRDTLIFAVPLAILTLSLLPALFSAALERGERPDLSGVARSAETVAQLLPTGASAQAMAEASQSQLFSASLWLVGSAIWLVALLFLWSLALRRSLVVPLATAPARARREGGSASDSLFPRSVRWLPRSRIGGVAAKELRVGLRDPRQRTALIGSAFGSLAFTLSALSDPGPWTVLRSCVIAFFIGANATNLYGFDGASHWMNVAAGDDARADLAGKCLARALLAGVGSLVMLIALAAFTDGWAQAGYALALCIAGLGLGLGPAAWVSVRYPSPAPANQRNVFAGANSGQGMQVLLPILVISILGFGTLGLLGWVMSAGSTVTALAALGAALFIGPGAYLVGFSRAVARSRDRQPELLLALTKA